MNQHRFYCFLLLLFFFSCDQRSDKKIQIEKNLPKWDHKSAPGLLGKKPFYPTSYQFVRDSVLHGYHDVLFFYFSKYAPDSCSRGFYDSTSFRDFEGMGYIGDINHNRTKDSFFVLYPISECQFPGEESWDGEAYYFTDTTLPRLQTSSYCCHPTSLFHVGDIDEDGISEIGQYYSSCASHYKSLYVYSLKKKQWKEVGHVVYDLFYADSTKPYSAYVRKNSRGVFEMLEITDMGDKKYIGQKHWKKFRMEQ